MEIQYLDRLVDELYDTRDILDETRRLTNVDRIIKELQKIQGSVAHLPPARQAVIATRTGYSYMLRGKDLQVWIPHLAQNKGPGEWVDFGEWFFQVDNYRTESAREALQAVETHGIKGIGSSPGYFGPHLRYGIHAKLLTQEDVDAVQKKYEDSRRR